MRRCSSPVQVGGRDLNADAVTLTMARQQFVEDRDLVGERHGEALEEGSGRRTQLLGQAGDEILVGLVDEPVLVAQGHRIGGAHADVAIGADDLLGGGENVGRRSRRATVEVLHGGDAALDHLEGGEQRVGIEIDIAQRDAAGEPEFQRVVGRAELQRRRADMVMRVDEARRDREVAPAGHGRVGIGRLQIGERPGRDDHPRLAGDACILQQDRVACGVEAGEERPAPDDLCGHAYSSSSRSRVSRLGLLSASRMSPPGMP